MPPGDAVRVIGAAVGVVMGLGVAQLRLRERLDMAKPGQTAGVSS